MWLQGTGQTVPDLLVVSTDILNDKKYVGKQLASHLQLILEYYMISIKA